MVARTLLPALKDACRRTVEAHADFWVLAALSDYSFEEGTRNRAFAVPVEAMIRHGADASLVEDLRGGINGVLAHELGRSHGVGTVVQSPNRSPDIRIGGRTGSDAAIEVKLLYDLTYSKYYRAAAEDRAKLLGHRTGAPQLELYQIAFAVQLPALDYPGARWYGRAQASRSRSDQIVRSGASQQLAELAARLGSPPLTVVPDARVIDLLPLASSTGLAVAQRWYAADVVPTTPWKFDPRGHLEGAGVAVGIWSY